MWRADKGRDTETVSALRLFSKKGCDWSTKTVRVKKRKDAKKT